MRSGSSRLKPPVKLADATHGARCASGAEDGRGRNTRRLENRAFNAFWIELRRTRRDSGPWLRKMRRTGRIRIIPRSSPETSSEVGIRVPPMGEPNIRYWKPEVTTSPLSKTKVGRFPTPDGANRRRIARGRALTRLRRLPNQRAMTNVQTNSTGIYTRNHAQKVPENATKRYARTRAGKRLPTTRLPMKN